MKIRQFEIWITDLSPRMGTEPGKSRPVVVLQTDLLNHIPHPSTIICPITTTVHHNVNVLRIHLKKGQSGLSQDSDIMIDQIRAIDNRRLRKKIGTLSEGNISALKERINVVLDL
jgi:mRNA interferase MazF